MIACSLIIPTYNAIAYLPRLIPTLLNQEGVDEIIIIDSNSTDGSQAYIKKFPQITLLSIPKEEFRHGGTRHHALLHSSSEFVIFLTQDALPTRSTTIKRLLSSFEDPTVALAYGRHIPTPDADPIEAHARYFNYPPHSMRKEYADRSRLGIKTPFCSNTFAAYRKSAYLEVGGFDKHLNFSEDMHIAAKLLQAGWSIHYNAEATVIHSHPTRFKEIFKRYWQIGRFHAANPSIIKDFGRAEGEGRRYVIDQLSYLLHNAPSQIPTALLLSATKYAAFLLGRHLPEKLLD